MISDQGVGMIHFAHKMLDQQEVIESNILSQTKK